MGTLISKKMLKHLIGEEEARAPIIEDSMPPAERDGHFTITTERDGFEGRKHGNYDNTIIFKVNSIDNK